MPWASEPADVAVRRASSGRPSQACQPVCSTSHAISPYPACPGRTRHPRRGRRATGRARPAACRCRRRARAAGSRRRRTRRTGRRASRRRPWRPGGGPTTNAGILRWSATSRMFARLSRLRASERPAATSARPSAIDQAVVGVGGQAARDLVVPAGTEARAGLSGDGERQDGQRLGRGRAGGHPSDPAQPLGVARAGDELVADHRQPQRQLTHVRRPLAVRPRRPPGDGRRRTVSQGATRSAGSSPGLSWGACAERRRASQALRYGWLGRSGGGVRPVGVRGGRLGCCPGRRDAARRRGGRAARRRRRVRGRSRRWSWQKVCARR